MSTRSDNRAASGFAITGHRNCTPCRSCPPSNWLEERLCQPWRYPRRILGIPKSESDTIRNFLFHQVAANVDFQVRFHWKPNSIAFWDNRIVIHTATFDFWPQIRHALRAMPHDKKPESVEDYERRTGKVAKDHQIEIWKEQGINRGRVCLGHAGTMTEMLVYALVAEYDRSPNRCDV